MCFAYTDFAIMIDTKYIKSILLVNFTCIRYFSNTAVQAALHH